ncbi:MAG: TetR family transcriptional regulator C-terminal domain-containing protein [Pikeienuella sp.]
MDGTTKLRTRRTAPKAVRRKQLIDATIDAIAELGVSRTTMAEITGRAGLSMGIVNLHFENKDNLLKSTLVHLSEELRDHWTEFQTAQGLGPAEKVWGIISANFHADVATRNKMRAWFAFFGEARYRAFYREMVADFDNERAEALETSLAQLKQDGAQIDFAPAALTQSIESMADGLWLSMILYPDWVSVDDARQRLWELLSNHFPARFPPGAPASMASIR